MNTTTKWQVYVGYMVETTAYRNQRWFNIYVPELRPNLSQDLNVTSKKDEVKVTNLYSRESNIEGITLKDTIYADYFGCTTSISVPTMYKGMQVLVINFAHGDKFYWVPLERDDDMKLFENYRISCNDYAITNKYLENATKGQLKGTGDNKSLFARDNIDTRHKFITDDNTYYFEIDTKYNKQVTIKTSSSDGEKYRYGFQIDARNNTIRIWDENADTITDRDGMSRFNEILIESKQKDPVSKGYGRITIHNSYGTSMVMDDCDMMIDVPHNLRIHVGNDVITSFDNNVTTQIGGNNIKEIRGTNTNIVLLDDISFYDMNRTSTVLGNVTRTIGCNWTETVTGNITFSMANFIINTVTNITITATNYTLTLLLSATVSAELITIHARKLLQLLSDWLLRIVTKYFVTPWII